MTVVQPADDAARTSPGVDMKLEVVVLPVSDVDRAKRFYASLGWREDADFSTSEDFRVIQFTPTGSQASIIFGKGLTSAEPGAVDALQLTVTDIDAAHDELVARGVEVSDVFHDAGGVFHHAGDEARVSGPADGHADYGSYLSFSDPDGNGWIMQEIRKRLPGRVTTTTFSSVEEVAGALRRAAAAHGEHEARTGEADENWPDWYAEYIVREAAGEELPR